MTSETTQPTNRFGIPNVNIISAYEDASDTEEKFLQRIAELEQERDELKVYCNEIRDVVKNACLFLAESKENVIKSGSYRNLILALVSVKTPDQSLADHDAQVIERMLDSQNKYCDFDGDIVVRVKHIEGYANNLRQQKDK